VARLNQACFPALLETTNAKVADVCKGLHCVFQQLFGVTCDEMRHRDLIKIVQRAVDFNHSLRAQRATYLFDFPGIDPQNLVDFNEDEMEDMNTLETLHKVVEWTFSPCLIKEIVGSEESVRMFRSYRSNTADHTCRLEESSSRKLRCGAWTAEVPLDAVILWTSGRILEFAKSSADVVRE